MIDLNPKLKLRTELFYGKWQYSLSAYVPEIHSLRSFSHESIDRCINVRRNVNFGGSWSYNNRVIRITDDEIKDLHSILDFLQHDQRARKFLIFTHHLYFYANDIDLIRDVKQLLSDTNRGAVLDICKVQLTGTPGTIQLKNPKHKHRTYLRSGRLSEKTCESIKSLLKSQCDIRLSPNLQLWCSNNNYYYVGSDYFFDHDHLGITYMLGMIHPIIRKTVPIEAAK